VRGVFFASVFLSLGIILQHSGPNNTIRLVITLVVLMGVFFTRRFKLLRVFLSLILFFLIGWTASGPFDSPNYPAESVRIAGNLYGPIQTGEKRQYRINLDYWQAGAYGGKLFGNAVFYTDQNYDLQPGDAVEIYGRIETIEGRRNPGGFNPKAYWGSRGVKYRLKQIKHIEKIDENPSFEPQGIINSIQGYIEKQIEQNGTVATTAYAKALLTGNRSGWEEPDRIQLANSGILHLFAISGLHIGLVTLILNMLFLSFKPQLRYVLLLISLWLFVPIVSANPPVVRAAIMVSFFLIGKLINRKANPVFHMFIVYMLLLLLRPDSLFDAGFQLTFAGTFGSLFAGSKFNSMLHVGSFKKYSPSIRLLSKYGMRFLYALTISFFAFATTSPIVIYHFGRIPWMGPIVSLLALPLIILILSSGWLMIFTSFSSVLTGIFASAMFGWIDVLQKMMKISTDVLPYNDWLSSLNVFPALISVIVLYLFSGRLKKVPISTSLIVLFIFLNLTVYPSLMIRNQTIKFDMLDVGQGDGFLLNRGSRTVLIDGGRSDTKVVLNQLRMRGLNRVDIYFLTHGDVDHTGAANKIIEKVDIGILVVGPEIWRDLNGREILKMAEKKNIPIIVANMGMSFELGDLGKMTILHPKKHYDPDLMDNDLSQVILWEVENTSVLFPGDISSEIEAEITDDFNVYDIDILVAAHHGSRYSTSEKWLKYWNPEIGLISCGKNNTYGHPSDDVLNRLNSNNMRVYRTDMQGCISFEMKNGKFVLALWD